MEKPVLEYLLAAWLAVVLAAAPSTAVLAQEEEPVAPAEQSEEEASEADGEDGDEIDDSDLDEQTYEEDEYDFTPSEEIPADQPIPFPSNI